MTDRKLKPPRVRVRKAKSNEQVGYGRPPKHSQFKPGQSGNPKGRPKGAKNQKTIFQEALDTQIAYLEQGKRRMASRRELMILKLVEKALKGDPRAINILLEKDAAFEETERKTEREAKTSKEEIDAQDKALLAELFPGTSGEEES